MKRELVVSQYMWKSQRQSVWAPLCRLCINRNTDGTMRVNCGPCGGDGTRVNPVLEAGENRDDVTGKSSQTALELHMAALPSDG